MKNRQAEITTEEAVKLILGAAVVFILIVLLYNLINPYFDKDKKTAESYFDTLKNEIAVADGGIGEFEIWQEQKDTKFFLVYFGAGVRAEFEEIVFLAPKFAQNQICLCYSKDEETFCNDCLELGSPADLYGLSSWAKGKGTRLSIEKEGQVYVFKDLNVK